MQLSSAYRAEHGSAYQNRNLHQGSWKQDLEKIAGLRNVTFSWVKLDGDAVGEAFLKAAPIDRCAMSLSLSSQIFEMHNKAVRACTKRLRQEKQLPHKVTPSAVDTQYTGGDDLLYCIPTLFVENFLTELESYQTHIGTEETIAAFSASVVDMPTPSLADDGPLLNIIAMRLLEPSLQLAKGKIKELGDVSEYITLDQDRSLALSIQNLDFLSGRYKSGLHGIRLTLGYA
jgi:hypothetical protein